MKSCSQSPLPSSASNTSSVVRNLGNLELAIMVTGFCWSKVSTVAIVNFNAAVCELRQSLLYSEFTTLAWSGMCLTLAVRWAVKKFYCSHSLKTMCEAIVTTAKICCSYKWSLWCYLCKINVKSYEVATLCQLNQVLIIGGAGIPQLLTGNKAWWRMWFYDAKARNGQIVPRWRQSKRKCSCERVYHARSCKIN